MTDDKKFSGNKAFLPVGITFIAVAIVFLATGGNAGLWIAFFTIGITFFVLSTQPAKPSTEEKSTDTET
jgi:hypothetical protein